MATTTAPAHIAVLIIAVFIVAGIIGMITSHKDVGKVVGSTAPPVAGRVPLLARGLPRWSEVLEASP
ncbi:hypothetical protein ACWGCW_11160 [Streptomyces sp. NPDC054933]